MAQLTFHRTKHDIDTIIKNTRGKLYRARCTKATTRVLILDGETVSWLSTAPPGAPSAACASASTSMDGRWQRQTSQS
ncbi:hypothetical protein GNAINCEL_00009 [Serratia phage KKP 3709]|nr:hypothetical protein GNAINCEL_00009 [Serratia phage KKP 3709]